MYMSHAIRTLFSCCLVVAMLGVLWTYAEEVSRSSVHEMRPERPFVLIDAPAGSSALAQISPWSAGDIDSLSS
jgi:hypothetical protein